MPYNWLWRGSNPLGHGLVPVLVFVVPIYYVCLGSLNKWEFVCEPISRIKGDSDRSPFLFIFIKKIMKKKARLLSRTAQVLLDVKENAKIEVENYLNLNFPSWKMFTSPPDTLNFLILEVGDDQIYIQVEGINTRMNDLLPVKEKYTIKKSLILIDTKSANEEDGKIVFDSCDPRGDCINHIKKVTGKDLEPKTLNNSMNGKRKIRKRFLVYSKEERRIINDEEE